MHGSRVVEHQIPRNKRPLEISLAPVVHLSERPENYLVIQGSEQAFRRQAHSHFQVFFSSPSRINSRQRNSLVRHYFSEDISCSIVTDRPNDLRREIWSLGQARQAITHQ